MSLRIWRRAIKIACSQYQAQSLPIPHSLIGQDSVTLQWLQRHLIRQRRRWCHLRTFISTSAKGIPSTGWVRRTGRMQWGTIWAWIQAFIKCRGQWTAQAVGSCGLQIVFKILQVSQEEFHTQRVLRHTVRSHLKVLLPWMRSNKLSSVGCVTRNFQVGAYGAVITTNVQGEVS